MQFNAQSLIGIAIIGVVAVIYFLPQIKTLLGKRSANYVPHAEVQTLIDYFTARGDNNGVDLATGVGKLIYESFKHPIPPVPINASNAKLSA